MSRYPMPSDIDPTESFMTIPEYIVIVTLGHFFDLILIAIFTIIAGVYFFTKKDLLGALATSSLVTWLLATLLWVSNLVSTTTFSITLGIMIVMFSALWIERNE